MRGLESFDKGRLVEESSKQSLFDIDYHPLIRKTISTKLYSRIKSSARAERGLIKTKPTLIHKDVPHTQIHISCVHMHARTHLQHDSSLIDEFN